jgi:hypothetical protein
MGAQHGTTIASIAFSRKRARGSRKAGMTLFFVKFLTIG